MLTIGSISKNAVEILHCISLPLHSIQNDKKDANAINLFLTGSRFQLLLLVMLTAESISTTILSTFRYSAIGQADDWKKIVLFSQGGAAATKGI